MYIKIWHIKSGARASINAESYYYYWKKTALSAKWVMNLKPEALGEAALSTIHEEVSEDLIGWRLSIRKVGTAQRC